MLQTPLLYGRLATGGFKEGEIMRMRLLIISTLLLAGLPLSADAQERNTKTVAVKFQEIGLIGKWSIDCGAPRLGEFYVLEGRTFNRVFDVATGQDVVNSQVANVEILSNTTFRLTQIRTDGSAVDVLTYVVLGRNIKLIDLRTKSGEVIVQNGRMTSSGEELQPMRRCDGDATAKVNLERGQPAANAASASQANVPSKSSRSAAVAALRREYGDKLILRKGNGLGGYALYSWTNPVTNTGGETLLKNDTEKAEWTIVDMDREGLDVKRLVSKGVPENVATELVSRQRRAGRAEGSASANPPSISQSIDEGDPSGVFGITIGMDAARAGRVIEQRFLQLPNVRSIKKNVDGGDELTDWESFGRSTRGGYGLVIQGRPNPVAHLYTASANIRFIREVGTGRALVSEVDMMLDRVDLDGTMKQLSDKLGAGQTYRADWCDGSKTRWKKGSLTVEACRNTAEAVGQLKLSMEDKEFSVRMNNAVEQQRGSIGKPKF